MTFVGRMKYLLDGHETERLAFRQVSLADWDQWLAFFHDPTSFQFWDMKMDAPEVECQKWYDKQLDRYKNDLGGMNALIEKSTGRLIGHCGLLVQTVDAVCELEVGYSLLGPFRGKGLATEAAVACRDFGFKQNFADSLISIISLANGPSANVALKNGMHPDKQTVYNGNAVNIFRIYKSDWLPAY